MDTPPYDFDWDAHKAVSNLSKHGVSFEQAASVFSDVFSLTVFDGAHSEFEERWFTLGFASAGLLLAVAHTFLAGDSGGAKIRIISARPATKQERRVYETQPR